MFDPLRSQLWHDERVEWWYRQNLVLFIRDDVVTGNPAWGPVPEITGPYGLRLIAGHIIAERDTLRGTLRRVPPALRASLRWHARRLAAALRRA